MSDLAAALLDSLDDAALDRLAERLAPRLEHRLAGSAEDAWLDSTAAAAHLGISRHALHRLTSARCLPFSQDAPGGRCYFKRTNLDQWRETGARGAR